MQNELIRPLAALLIGRAAAHGDRTAFADDARAVTYAELEARTRRLAGHLAERGVARGARVVILLGNRVETLEAYYAVNRAAAIGVPADPRSADPELARLLEASGATAVVTDEAHAVRVARLAPSGTLLVVAGGPVDGTVAFETLATTEPAEPARDDLGLDETAWILFTSGTTGKPKGVRSSQRNCLWTVASCYAPVLGLTETDRVLWPMPLHHSFAHVFCVHAALATGASVRIMSGFSPDDVLERVRTGSFTLLVGVPAMYQRLVAAAGDGLTAPDLRVGVVTGAVAEAGLRESFETAFKAPLIDSYGSTETCGAITMTRPDGRQVPGSCGLPVPGLGIRLVDLETGLDVPDGAEGEVWVSGPSVMEGYHEQPDATAEALRDGWYRTGDLARRGSGGFLTITGRLKELIIRGGENIHPGEIEAAVRGLPGISDAAAAPLPDHALGETPALYVVPAPGFDPAGVFTACAAALAPHKIPTHLFTTSEIPRVPSGKIARHLLPANAARLTATRALRRDRLFHPVWNPRTDPADANPTDAGGDEAGSGAEAVVVLGEDPAGLAGAGVRGVAEAAQVPAGAGVVVVPFLPGSASVTEAAEELRSRVEGVLAEVPAGVRVVVLTVGPVVAPVGADPVHTVVWGVVRSLAAARPGRVGAADSDAAPDAAGPLVRVLAEGLPEVAVRAGRVFVPALRRAAAPGVLELPELGPVLITGGGVGRAIARKLTAEQRPPVIVLAGPEEIDELPEGTEMTVCDLTDPGAVAAVVARHRFTAVVHTDPDPAGLWTVHEATLGLGLDHFVIFETAAGILGDPADPAGAARSSHAEAVARHRGAEGERAVAILWGPTSAQELPDRLRDLGLEALFPADALPFFDAALALDEPVLVPLALDTSALSAATAPPLLRDLAPDVAGETPDGLRDRLLALPPARRRTEIADVVRAEAAEVLGEPGPVPGERSFADLGMTSLTAVRLRNRLAARFGIPLPVAVAFDHPTAASLTDRLVTALLGGDRPAAAVHADDL
ncbi:AMP-binding protein, partial [Actinocorallia aurantiaca]